MMGSYTEAPPQTGAFLCHEHHAFGIGTFFGSVSRTQLSPLLFQSLYYSLKNVPDALALWFPKWES